MRIALRTSGGRGEYELTGVHGDISIRDLFEKQLDIELLPGTNVATGNIVRQIQGKPRIRLATVSDRHLYLILADALLLPKPKRELGATPTGKLQLVNNNYSITSIQFDVVSISSDSALIRPTSVLLENSGRGAARLEVVERLRILLDLWNAAASGRTLVEQQVLAHRRAVTTGDGASLMSVAAGLRANFGKDGDPLRAIVHEFSVDLSASYWMAIHEDDVESVLEDDLLEDRREAARKRLKLWRLQASRGSAGAKFAKEVKRAYRHRCLFTGAYLPKTDEFGISGVDSAHILPWAEYDLNEVTNGLCLSKTCHWAFDQGILLLTFDSAVDRYALSISPRALAVEAAGKFDLAVFKPMIGVLPQDRLPLNREQWPNPNFLHRYNDSLV